jgi:cold shock protein
MSSQRETGPVKWFDKAKGFGFITRNTPNGTEDVFVHYNAIKGEGFRLLYEGQTVEYTVRTGEKGLQADDVIILEDTTSNAETHSDISSESAPEPLVEEAT